MMMLNPFKIFSLAADARRAEAILGEHFVGATLAAKADVAVVLLESSRADNNLLGNELNRAHEALAAANAKIAKMTSGLKRGPNKAA